MSSTSIPSADRHLEQIIATLADLHDYLVETSDGRREDRDQRSLETFTSDALCAAVQARRSAASLAIPPVKQ